MQRHQVNPQRRFAVTEAAEQSWQRAERIPQMVPVLRQSTARPIIAVSDAQLTANGSEAAPSIEGLNSIHLFNSDLTGNMAHDEQNDCTWNVILLPEYVR